MLLTKLCNSYANRPRIFCEMADACANIAVPDCAKIWFLARSAASAAKSTSSMLDLADSMLWMLLVKLDMVNCNLFCSEPT